MYSMTNKDVENTKRTEDCRNCSKCKASMEKYFCDVEGKELVVSGDFLSPMKCIYKPSKFEYWKIERRRKRNSPHEPDKMYTNLEGNIWRVSLTCEECDYPLTEAEHKDLNKAEKLAYSRLTNYCPNCGILLKDIDTVTLKLKGIKDENERR